MTIKDQIVKKAKELGMTDENLVKFLDGLDLEGPKSLEELSPGLKSLVDKAIEEKVTEKSKVTKDQLYDTLQKLRDEVKALKESTTQEQSAKDAESKKLEEEKKAIEDAKKSTEQKLIDLQKELESVKITSAKTTTEEIDKLNKKLALSELVSLRKDLIFSAKGEILEELVVDPNYIFNLSGKVISAEEIKESAEKAIVKFKDLKVNLTKDITSSSSFTGKPSSNGSVIPGKETESPANEFKILSAAEYASMSEPERKAYKDKLYAHHNVK